jgi:hypothetical protein
MNTEQIVFWFPGQGPDDDSRVRGQVEYAKEKTKELFERKPDDKYPRLGAFIGFIIGLIIGIKTGNGNIFWVVGCIIAGSIVGVLLGSLAGTLRTRYLRSKQNRPGN